MLRHGPTVRSRELGLALARAAKAKGITNRKLARGLGWSDSKVCRIFNGNRGATIPDVAALCALCGIKGPKRAELLNLAERAHEPGWWQEFGDRLPPELCVLSDYEDAAIAITNFETVVVPGLLQTVGYMCALMNKSPAIPAQEIPKRIESRVRRQEIFNREHPARFRFFLDEYALARTGPGQDVMSEQVHHLLRMSVRSYVEIRIIPDAVGFHAGRIPFKLIQFTEFHPIVFIEHQTSVLFLERPNTTDAYRRIVSDLASVALDEEQSRAWLASLATELGAPREEHDEHAPPLEEEFPQ